MTDSKTPALPHLEDDTFGASLTQIRDSIAEVQREIGARGLGIEESFLDAQKVLEGAEDKAAIARNQAETEAESIKIESEKNAAAIVHEAKKNLVKTRQLARKRASHLNRKAQKLNDSSGATSGRDEATSGAAKGSVRRIVEPVAALAVLLIVFLILFAVLRALLSDNYSDASTLYTVLGGLLALLSLVVLIYSGPSAKEKKGSRAWFKDKGTLILSVAGIAFSMFGMFLAIPDFFAPAIDLVLTGVRVLMSLVGF